ncbi:terminase [Psittacid alphaherpesvirus 1]|uniref:Tripartite terminase subunit 3 n=1 Tax=Psittacid herpesvirus 1 (isolate Amazon parrot/-/97-0001/1997) TaxID=670426 RepID=TRM3_PSHV1|nr:RecName: Full=Tripartite terminase subunit 3; AltName: Full=Terminase large subunit [Psittacid herpesvirus 1 Amazon parrot/1997]AAQ73728.1 terminase [Psittacid alphaherpesvirus 1]
MHRSDSTMWLKYGLSPPTRSPNAALCAAAATKCASMTRPSCVLDSLTLYSPAWPCLCRYAIFPCRAWAIYVRAGNFILTKFSRFSFCFCVWSPRPPIAAAANHPATSTIVARSQGLRGQDFNFLFVDEANFIKPGAMHTIMGFLNQTNCKLFFVSSTNTGQSSTSLLYNLKGSSNSLLNVVTYICDDHLPEVQQRQNVTTCSCYVLQKPVYVTMDHSVRNTAELFVKDSFMNEIAGGQVGNTLSARSVIASRAMDQFLVYRPSTSNSPNVHNLSRVLTAYIDPAFTANRSASGTGIALVTELNGATVLLGMEHFYLEALTGEAAAEIAQCANLCVAYTCLLHPGVFREVRVAVEGNSSQDSATAIALRLADLLAPLQKRLGFSLVFAHTRQHGSSVAHPFYLLNKQKSRAFDLFISRFNSGNIMASQELVSNTVLLGNDPCEYLVEQIKNLEIVITSGDANRVYSGKQGGKLADDVLVAVVMAAYLSFEGAPPAGYHTVSGAVCRR